MLEIIVPSIELYDESKEEFINIKEQKISLEHSLASLSKWESKWNKPFLSKKEKTNEEAIDYIKCMTITQNIKPIIYENLTNENLNDVSRYISLPMTATVFNDNKKTASNEIITSEIIYYWMITYNIPFKCEKWHLNRLLALIRVCQSKNSPNKKMSKSEILQRNRDLNNKRRKQLNTKG